MNSLLPATLALAVAGILAAWLLRRFQVQSPLLHRLTWGLVLAQGLIFAGIRIELPVLDPPATGPSVFETAALPAPMENSGVAETEGPAAEVSAAGLEQAVGGIQFDPWQAIETIWILGAGATLMFYLLSYVSLLLAVRRTGAAPQDWDDQWKELLAAGGLRKAIPLRVHERLGPLLCRLPRGYAVVVPAAVWRELSYGQRRAVLEHEIAHIRRGDIWKTFLARLAVVPHWFNPMAWRAVRQFEEAAEWDCDRKLAARDARAVDYAKALLQLAEPKRPLPLGASLARGAALSPRIDRLVNGHRKGDSLVKRLTFFLMIAALTVTAAVRFDLVAQESDEVKVAVEPDPEFAEKLAGIREKLIGSGEQLDAFREAIGTPAGQIAMKDRVARVEEKLKQVARDQSLIRYIDQYFERTGSEEEEKWWLRETEHDWAKRLRKLHKLYSDDIDRLRPAIDELAANLSDESEAEKLLIRFIGEEGAAELLYVTALQKKTRPDVYSIAEELGTVFASDGEGGFEVPESRAEAASVFIRRGLKQIELSKMLHEELVILAGDVAEPDEMHKRLKAAAGESLFAAVAAAQMGKKMEKASVAKVFDEAMSDIDGAFIDRGNGLHLREDADRADVEKLLDTYEAAAERAGILREPVLEFATLISEKDEHHRQWRTFVESEVGLVTLIGAVKIGTVEPGELFKSMVGSVLEPAGDGKQRVQEGARDKIIENMQEALKNLREARRKGRQFDRLAEKIEDESLREIFLSMPGKLIAGQAIKRQLETEKFDGLGFWIQQHFDQAGDGRLTPNAKAGEAISGILKDAEEIAANLKSDF